MTPLRLGFFIVVSFLVATPFIFPIESTADDLLLRKAAIPSPTRDLTYRTPSDKNQLRYDSRKTRIGLSPVPYTPHSSGDSAIDPE